MKTAIVNPIDYIDSENEGLCGTVLFGLVVKVVMPKHRVFVFLF